MGQTFLIMLREGLEAALIVAIVLAYLRRLGRRDLFGAVWWGTGAAGGVSLAAGIVLLLVFGGLDGAARMEAFGTVSLTAAAVLTWMIFWMRKQSRHLSGELRRQVDEAVAGGSSTFAIAALAFFTVVREGLETALFLVAASLDGSATGPIAGALAGLAGAVGLGYLVYRGGRRIPMRAFFRTTGLLLIVFAAGLLAKAVFFLQAAGALGTLNGAVYDLTAIRSLTVDSQTGRFLAGLFGWDPRPSLEQVLAYLGYLVPVSILFLREPRMPQPRRAGLGALSTGPHGAGLAEPR
ncbi:MAG: FTR1 family iron permease [Egibacteraceae bacterium]